MTVSGGDMHQPSERGEKKYRERAFLGLGSNIPDRHIFIENALEEIAYFPETEIIRCSMLYETEPWGIRSQHRFLNSAAEIRTNLKVEKLFELIKSAELKVGRNARGKWLEREIDIDLLFYGNSVLKSKGLRIPHDEIPNRRFVLIPLCEIAPEFVHPVLNKTLSSLLEETRDTSDVWKYTKWYPKNI